MTEPSSTNEVAGTEPERCQRCEDIAGYASLRCVRHSSPADDLDTQTAVHQQTSEDLQVWRRRAQAAEDTVTEVKHWQTVVADALEVWITADYMAPVVMEAEDVASVIESWTAEHRDLVDWAFCWVLPKARALIRRARAAEAIVERLTEAHGRYFDTDLEPGDANSNPEPEDVWRYDRDFRAALADPAAGDGS